MLINKLMIAFIRDGNINNCSIRSETDLRKQLSSDKVGTDTMHLTVTWLIRFYARSQDADPLRNLRHVRFFLLLHILDALHLRLHKL